ncbi:hypothetical protein, partial [uncultured Gimesia sp.]|uniref:hypothetical protein n=1 Tax=uncultured Gimesia sp. TaxID=1678688 RepID=UPI00261B2520
MTIRLRLLKMWHFPVLALAITLFPMLEIQAQPTSKTQLPPGTSPSQKQSPEIKAELIQKNIDQVKNIKDLSEENQKKAIDFYNQALGNLKKASEFQDSAHFFETNSKNVMQRLSVIKVELKQKSNQPTPSFSHIKILSDLEQELAKAETQYEEDKKALSTMEAEYSSRANRQKEALARISAIHEKAAEIDKQLKVPAPVNEPTAVTTARETELTTQLNQFLFEKPALKNELASYDAEDTVGFPRIKLDFLKLKLEKQKETVDVLKKQIKNRRNIESEMRVKEARKEVFATNPLLQPLAEQNQKYAEEILQLNKKIEGVDQSISNTSQILEDLKKQFTQTKLKEESVGLTGPIGLLLRTQQ